MSHRRVFAGLACLLFLLCDSASAADEERSELSCAGGYAPSFRLTGAVRTPDTFDAAALATLPASRQSVDFFAGPSGLVRLVVRGDKKGGRYVSNIARIVVRAASE